MNRRGVVAWMFVPCLLAGGAGSAEDPAFTAAPGAPLPVWQWKYQRDLPLPAATRYGVVVLGPDDLVRLAADRRDLRIVDRLDRQVPWLVGDRPIDGAVALEVEPRAAVLERLAGMAVSRWRLRLPAPAAGGRGELPLRSVELSFVEQRFARRGRLIRLGDPPIPHRHRWRRRLERRDAFDGWLRGTGAGGSRFTIALDGSPVAEFRLEIEDGDSAPLTMIGATARVDLPRIAFPIVETDLPYRLLLGHPGAHAPVYDIASDPATPAIWTAVDAGPLVPNPHFRPRLRDYLLHGERTGVLWGVVALTVALLLWITARLLPRHASSRFG